MKTFALKGVQPLKNCVNIPIFWTMTNGMMAHSIEQEIRLQNFQVGKYSTEVEKFLKTLLNDSEGQFIDPCLNCDDCIVLAFGITDKN